MPSTSRLSEHCRRCNLKDDCDKKRMELCAYIKSPPIASKAGASAMSDPAMPVIKNQDLREIKIDKNTTITIDLEDLKREFEREIYRGLGCYFEGGA